MIFRRLKIWICLLLLSAAACAIQPDLRKAGSQSGDIPRTSLIVWLTQDREISEKQTPKIDSLLEKIVASFTKLYPNIQIVFDYIPEAELVKQVSQQVERGFGPNLILTSYGYIPTLQRANILQSLDEYALDFSVFRAEALQQVRYQGKLYGLPIYLHLQALCYNKKKVKQLPRTLDELVVQSRKGYSVGLSSGFFQTYWGTGIFGGRGFSNQLASSLQQQMQIAWVRWMTWLKQARGEPNIILSQDSLALQQSFVEGNLAYLTCDSRWIPFLRGSLGKDIGVTLLPQGKEGAASPLLHSAVMLFNRASSAGQTRAALRFAQFLSNQQQQKNWLVESWAADIPANRTVNLDRRLYPVLGAFLEQARTARVIPLARLLDSTRTTNLRADIESIDLLYEKVLAGEITAAEAAAKIGKIINNL